MNGNEYRKRQKDGALNKNEKQGMRYIKYKIQYTL